MHRKPAHQHVLPVPAVFQPANSVDHVLEERGCDPPPVPRAICHCHARTHFPAQILVMFFLPILLLQHEAGHSRVFRVPPHCIRSTWSA